MGTERLDYRTLMEDIKRAYPDAEVAFAIYDLVDEHRGDTEIFMKRDIQRVKKAFAETFPGAGGQFGRRVRYPAEVLLFDEDDIGSLNYVTVEKPKGEVPVEIAVKDVKTLRGRPDRLALHWVRAERYFELSHISIASEELFEEAKTVPPNDEVLLRQDYREEARKRFDKEWKSVRLCIDETVSNPWEFSAPNYGLWHLIGKGRLKPSEKMEELMKKNGIGPVKSRKAEEDDEAV